MRRSPGATGHWRAESGHEAGWNGFCQAQSVRLSGGRVPLPGGKSDRALGRLTASRAFTAGARRWRRPPVPVARVPADAVMTTVVVAPGGWCCAVRRLGWRSGQLHVDATVTSDVAATLDMAVFVRAVQRQVRAAEQVAAAVTAAEDRLEKLRVS